MIQIIAYDTSKYNEFSKQKYKISKLGEIQALDDFEICIIDLSDENIWRYNGAQPDNINCYKDLLTIKESILNSTIARVIIVLPQNEIFSYSNVKILKNGRYEDKLDKTIYLKDNKENEMYIINKYLLNTGNLRLLFEKTKTSIEDNDVEADFNFNNYKEEGFETITFSKNSNKVTTIQKDRIIITTLDILQNQILELFIKSHCREKTEKEEIPDWIIDVKFYNDEQLKEDKNSNNEKIQELKEKNIKLEEQLIKNLE